MLAALVATCSLAAASSDELPALRASIDVGQAPHQIVFTHDGSQAAVAVAGSDVVALVDSAAPHAQRTWAASGTPLGIATGPTPGAFIVSSFGGRVIERRAPDGAALASLDIGAGPSFLMPGPSLERVTGHVFAQRTPAERVTFDDRLFVSLERSNELVVLDATTLDVRARFATGARPFPPGITSDGRLAFVPNHDDGTVTVIDLWNERTWATVDVGAQPTGATVLPGDDLVAIAVRGEDRLALIDTADFEVRATVDGVGEGPFSIVTSPDRTHVFVNAADSHEIATLRYDAHTRCLTLVGTTPAGEIPIAMAVHPDGRSLWVSCEGSHELQVFDAPFTPPAPASTAITDVAVMGMTHSGHVDSEVWGLAEVEATVRAFAPDAILAEIPPNRWLRIHTDWATRQAIDDPRLRRFPEYVDALFELSNELGFEIVPTAAWTREMNDLRRARMDTFENATERAEPYRADVAASEASLPPAPEPSDDPHFIHSSTYDARTEVELGPYDRHMNDWIGPGGWTNINRAHMRLVHAAIDARRGQRLLVTFGAGHKGRFLDELRARPDVRILSLDDALPRPTPMNDADTVLCRNEVVALHDFFSGWFRGELANDDASFARFADALAPQFELIPPSGAPIARAPLLDMLRSAHGQHDATSEIDIRALRSRALDDNTFLVVYEEWQRSSANDAWTARTSTAVLERSAEAPGGLLWQHVHETALP